MAGVRCVQLVPSHSHVSSNVLPVVTPPNRTSLFPYTAMAAFDRVDGFGTGVLFVQVVPSHSHMSPNSSLVSPPNSTTLFPSVAIAAPCRRFSSGTSVQVAGVVACARAALAIAPTRPTAASAVTTVRAPINGSDGTSAGGRGGAGLRRKSRQSVAPASWPPSAAPPVQGQPSSSQVQ